MRTFTLLFSALVLGTTAMGQAVATFESPALPVADTYYVNYSGFGTDVGFNDGLAHFPCVYDTSGGYSFWSYGFAYSNMTDSVTSGFGNQYAAKTAAGYNLSAQYAVAYCYSPVTFTNTMNLNLIGAAIGEPVSGFYITNSTYAYNSMRSGDAFARKFHDGDWFLLTVKGFTAGALTTDSVNFYLADFRFTDSSMNYLVKNWQWVNLASLGHVDSLQFQLSSTDNGSFGMNTPAYFCMDNFTTNEGDVAVKNTQVQYAAKVYPNPAVNTLYVDIADNAIQQVSVMDMTGNVLGVYNVTGGHVEINTSALAAGLYTLQLMGNGKSATTKFVKQ